MFTTYNRQSVVPIPPLRQTNCGSHTISNDKQPALFSPYKLKLKVAYGSNTISNDRQPVVFSPYNLKRQTACLAVPIHTQTKGNLWFPYSLKRQTAVRVFPIQTHYKLKAAYGSNTISNDRQLVVTIQPQTIDIGGAWVHNVLLKKNDQCTTVHNTLTKLLKNGIR